MAPIHPYLLRFILKLILRKVVKKDVVMRDKRGGSCVFTALPAVPAAVFLRDVVLGVAPDVDRRQNQGDQHGQAAQEGNVGDALLLALGDDSNKLERRLKTRAR